MEKAVMQTITEKVYARNNLAISGKGSDERIKSAMYEVIHETEQRTINDIIKKAQRLEKEMSQEVGNGVSANGKTALIGGIHSLERLLDHLKRVM